MPRSRTETGNAEGRQQTYLITAPEQLKALVSARRQEIVDHLAAAGKLSVKELADSLGQHPSALYHHLKLLREVGLVRSAGSRITNRRREELFETPAVQMRYGMSVKDPEFRAIFGQLNSAQCRQVDRDFSAGLDNDLLEESGAARNLRSFRVIGAPDPDALAEINHHLEQIVRLMWESAGQEYPKLMLSCVMAPLPDRRSASDTDKT